MDANTAGVLNSILNIVSIIVTGLISIYVARSNRKMDVVKSEVQTVTAKVEEYHKEVNGNMTKLLQTTKDLATLTERTKGEAEEKHKQIKK